MTDTLETALQIAARPVVADTRSFVTLVNIDTVALTGTKFIASWTHAFEVALLIDTLRVPATGIWYLQIIIMNNSFANYFRYSRYRSYQLI